MAYKEILRRIIAEACRLLLGCVFVFSGFVKAVDPMGGAIKFDDYLTSFGLDFLLPFSTLFSFNLAALEFTLGICALLGVYRRYTSFFLLAMMTFLTPLTLYLAIFNPVSDCGCFGDALVITNWQTFYKNVVLLAAAIFLFRNNQRIYPFYSYHVYWFVAFYGYLFAVAFAYMNYSHLPILDFRPYKVGANIPALMAIPEGAPVDEYDYSFIYEKDGIQKEFSLEDIPSNDSSWVFVESKTKLIKQGYVPPVAAFNVYDMRDEDVTERLFSNPDPMFLLVSPHLEEADDERIDEINSIYDYAVERGWSFYCITGSSEEAMSAWTDNTGAEYPYLFADEVLLKTIIRSNPGLVLMREGTILGKWHYNDFPSAEALETAFDPYLTGNYDRKSEEDAKLLTNLLTFILPLSLVWVYDGFRFRRRKRNADN